MFEEEKKHVWVKIIGIVIISFLAAFFAFYCAMELMIHKISDPMYNTRKIEKMMTQQEKNFRRMEDVMSENPFEPKMRPMLVNMVRENNEYKLIVDLKPLNGNENAVNTKFDNNTITVSGEVDKQTLGGEKMLSFSQSYYFDEKIDKTKITKEKKGNKYIITIPFAE